MKDKASVCTEVGQTVDQLGTTAGTQTYDQGKNISKKKDNASFCVILQYVANVDQQDAINRFGSFRSNKEIKHTKRRRRRKQSVLLFTSKANANQPGTT